MRIALLNPALNLQQAHQVLSSTGLSLADTQQHRSGLFSAKLLTGEGPAADNAANNTANNAADKLRLAAHFKSHQCDWALLPSDFAPQHIKVLAMDMDSTLINIECIDEIADFVGKKAEVSAITEAAMRGEIKDFSESLRRRVALLAGVDASNLEAVFKERLRLNPGADQLLAFARQHGWTTLLVSGGFTFFTDRLQAQLGLHVTRSNTLEIVEGKLTGQVLGDIVDAQRKADTVVQVCEQVGAKPNQALVMGDGANDLMMMSIAGVSVAYRAKPVVQEQARFAINFNGLDTVNAWFQAAGAA